MNADFKTAWVAALRSGEYKQARGHLRSADGTLFCCLGVAYDIQPDNEWTLQRERAGTQLAAGTRPVWFAHVEGDNPEKHCALWGAGMLARAGITAWDVETDSETPEYEAYKELSGLNDSGATFEKIADFIEKNL